MIVALEDAFGEVWGGDFILCCNFCITSLCSFACMGCNSLNR